MNEGRQGSRSLPLPQVDIRNYRQGNAEVVLTYPHPNIRIVATRTTAGVLAFSIAYLFTDQLGSIRDVVKGAVRSSVSTYEPFGNSDCLGPKPTPRYPKTNSHSPENQTGFPRPSPC